MMSLAGGGVAGAVDGVAADDGDAGAVSALVGDAAADEVDDGLAALSGLAWEAGLVNAVPFPVPGIVQAPTIKMSPASNVTTRHPPLIYVSARIVRLERRF
jgi:hypothetical protein